MTNKNTYKKLKDELSVLYPGVTDAELNEMTDRLIKVFAVSARALYEAEKADSPLTDINVTNSEQHSSKKEKS